MTTAAEVLKAARYWGVRIATAESCTGGLIAGALTDVAGSSDVFERGFVTYSNAAKQDMLGVKADTLQAHGAVSEPVAREMAEGALRASRAQLAVAVTGIAGPGACASPLHRMANQRRSKPWSSAPVAVRPCGGQRWTMR